MPEGNFEVLMVGSTERFYKLRHNILHADLIVAQGSWQLATHYLQTYPVAINTIATFERVDLVLVYNDLGLSPKWLQKFCKELAAVLAAHPNKPAVGLDRAVMVGEAEEAIEKIFRKAGVSVSYGDIGDIFHAVIRSKAIRALN